MLKQISLEAPRSARAELAYGLVKASALANQLMPNVMAMNKRNTFFLIPILFIMANCSQRQIIDKQEAIDDLATNGIIVDLSFNEQELVNHFGQPLKIEVEEINNPYYNEFKDASIHYFYSGLEIIYYHHNHPEHGWKKIKRIEVTTNDYDLKYGIKIGMHASEIYKLFGPSHFPKWESAGIVYLGYQTEESVHDQILFALKDDKLDKFIWSDWP